MKKTSIILLIGLLLLSSQFPCAAQDINPPDDIEDSLAGLANANPIAARLMPREVIIRIDPTKRLSDEQQKEVLEATGYLTIKEGPTPITQFWLCTITAFPDSLEIYNNQEDSIRGVIKRVSTTSTEINGAGLNYVFNYSPLRKIPNLTTLPMLLGNCKDTSFSVSILFGPYNTRVGVTDTGISSANRSLFSSYIKRLGSGQNYISGRSPKDDNGHGTHMASILINGIPTEATSENSIPSLYIHKTHNDSGQSTLFDLLQSIDQGIADGVKVTNMSFSYYAPYNERDDSQNPLRIAMATAGKQAGTLFITAAGNENINNDNSSNDITYPASFDLDNIIAVAAVDCLGNIAEYSGRGKKSVDIAAPGEAIIGAYLNENEYAEITGTSPATAIVTRVATMLASHQETFNYEAIKRALLKSVTPHISLSESVKSGGYINAAAALCVLDKNRCDVLSRTINSPSNLASKSIQVNTSITPTTINLTIDASQSQTGIMRVFTTQGHLLYKEQLTLQKGANQVQWRFSEQAFSNLYFVQVQVGGQLETIKVLR